MRPKTSVFHVASLTKDHEAQGKTSTRRETRPSLAEDNSKTSNTYNPMVFLVPLDAFFHCAIDEHDVMPSRPRNEMLLPWKVYPHWDADFCMEDR